MVVNSYENNPRLRGCVRNTVEIATLFKFNGDSSPNFDMRRITSNLCQVSAHLLERAINDLCVAESETVLLNFSGHWTVNEELDNGYLVAEDGCSTRLGVSLSDLIDKANAASPKIKSTVFVLDSCHSGIVAETSAGPKARSYSQFGQGVTILSACHRHYRLCCTLLIIQNRISKSTYPIQNFHKW